MEETEDVDFVDASEVEVTPTVNANATASAKKSKCLPWTEEQILSLLNCTQVIGPHLLKGKVGVNDKWSEVCQMMRNDSVAFLNEKQPI